MKATIKEGDPPVKENNHTQLGGDPSNPTWEEYLESFKEEYQPYILAIKELYKKEGFPGITGETFSNYFYFEFDDEHHTTLNLSWRAFGDLMQALANKREGYMAYYM